MYSRHLLFELIQQDRTVEQDRFSRTDSTGQFSRTDSAGKFSRTDSTGQVQKDMLIRTC
jgi:hypothetical protein